MTAGTFTDCVEMVETEEGGAGSVTTWWSPTVQNFVKRVNDMSYPAPGSTEELASYKQLSYCPAWQFQNRQSKK